MKKQLILVFILASFLGFSQTKKKVYKKKTTNKGYVKKTVENKTVPIVDVKEEPSMIETTEKPVEVNTVEAVPVNVQEEKPKYEITAEKILKEKGYINNRNSAIVNGIEGFVKGVYSGNGKIYVLLEIDNRSNINYDIESAVFITAPIEKGRALYETDEQEKTFMPIFSNQPESFSRKTKNKLIYVFDKFTISENKTIQFALKEIEGERSLTLEIKPKYILEANSTK
ncbi:MULTISPECIES: DUF4138 domain-containing protein [Chryseobacterium]|uniref:DUF4138 domain-containing protein n=1 Tax=Chryseobacterium muglaense TaxID=2893752 RepID=A0ABR8MA23_9FLAO|nr:MULTISPECIES: DUF4138 domain-containing protein [Chryseobacterium]MBD3906761.1 DUF4138 domain-containing protein [Chryseobacterium muglaense]